MSSYQHHKTTAVGGSACINKEPMELWKLKMPIAGTADQAKIFRHTMVAFELGLIGGKKKLGKKKRRS